MIIDRRCERCDIEMIKRNYISINFGGISTWAIGELDSFSLDSFYEEPKIAICPRCGKIEFYIEEITNLKRRIEKRDNKGLKSKGIVKAHVK